MFDLNMPIFDSVEEFEKQERQERAACIRQDYIHGVKPVCANCKHLYELKSRPGKYDCTKRPTVPMDISTLENLTCVKNCFGEPDFELKSELQHI